MQTDDIDDGTATPLLRITHEELSAYAEGGLPPSRRARIAGFLACNADLAAEVMRMTHLRERSRAASIGTRFSPRAGRGRRGARLAVAGLACAIVGWAFATGMDEDGPLQGLLKAPEYVEDAVMSWRATHLRISMHSQEQTASLDVEELRRMMHIRVPVLPHDWQLLDAQVYPSESGPGISLLLETTQGRQLNLFAVRSSTAATSTPEITVRHGANAAYWELEDAAYVLTGDDSPAEILKQATQLSLSGLM